jgi:hypothetical protein
MGARVVITWLLRALAIALLASTFASAVHDVSQAWDVWYYHLPFAARLWGIVPADAFAFHASNEARWQGFPLLGEALQGLLWKITGRLQAANLVAFASVPLLALFLRRVFAVPFHLGVIALFAVPLVMTHATSCYVDLPANACAAALVLLVWRAWSSDAPLRPRAAAGAGLLAAAAAGMRFQLLPVLGVALLALAPRALRAGKKTTTALVIASSLVLAWPVKNAVAHGNPVYPVQLSIAGHVLPGPETPYASSPPSLARAPRPQRWLWSVLEIGARPLGSTRRWTVDQWAPPDDDAYRMGGFFGAYVVAMLALFAWHAWRSWASRRTRAAVVTLAALTAIVSMLPQSHELRYYMVWMLALVGLALATAPVERRGPVTIACVAALAAVIAATRAGYIYPSGSDFSTFLRDKVSRETVDAIEDGERACLSREPLTFLYASTFHPGRRYSVKEAEDRAECGAYRWIE